MSVIISGLGASSLAASATTTPTVALSQSTVNRNGVIVTNCDASKKLYVLMTADFSNAPTVDSTHLDLIVQPFTTVQLSVGKSVAIWIASESGTVTYCAKEVQF